MRNYSILALISLIGIGAFFCCLFLLALFFWMIGLNKGYNLSFIETVIFLIVSVGHLLMTYSLVYNLYKKGYIKLEEV